MDNITGLKIRSSSFTYLKLMSRQKGQENTGFQKDPPSLCLKSKPDLGWVVGQAFRHPLSDNVPAEGIFTGVGSWPACHYTSVLLSHFLCLCGAHDKSLKLPREAGLPLLTKRE